ncbi:hypothetical protein BC830DRAFT_1167241 [Chytriomyces sp. MP71]|nr:hypothetical protein BC830DRAFT_1167241 [Chytriomyces sp. MP71]
MQPPSAEEEWFRAGPSRVFSTRTQPEGGETTSLSLLAATVSVSPPPPPRHLPQQATLASTPSCVLHTCVPLSPLTQATPHPAQAVASPSRPPTRASAASQALSALAALYTSCVANSTCSGVYASQATEAYNAPAQKWAGNVYYNGAERAAAAFGLMAAALLF